MSERESLHTFAPSAAAGAIGITVTTIRRWAEYHAPFLSSGANPPSGENRRFTWEDIELLRKVKEWRDEGASTDSINIRLAETNTKIAVNPVTTSQEGQGAHVGGLVAQNDVVPQILAIQHQIEAIRQNQRDRFGYFAYGILVGLAFAAFVLLAVLALR